MSKNGTDQRRDTKDAAQIGTARCINLVIKRCRCRLDLLIIRVFNMYIFSDYSMRSTVEFVFLVVEFLGISVICYLAFTLISPAAALAVLVPLIVLAIKHSRFRH